MSLNENSEYTSPDPDELYQRINHYHATKPVSVRNDILIILYLGVISLATGIGMLVYTHINTFGHIALLALIGIASAQCFLYADRKRLPFSRQFVPAPNVWYDYIILFGALLLIVFVGYMQYRYHPLGQSYNYSAFILMIIFFYLAYLFDHRGVLCMAISNLAAWLSLSVDPMKVLGFVSNASKWLVINAVFLGVILLLSAIISIIKDYKAHFAKVYNNFGYHILMIALLVGYYVYNTSPVFFLLAMLATAYFYFKAMQARSMYYLVFVVLYAYISISSIVITLIYDAENVYDSVFVLFIYFAVSLVLANTILYKLAKKIKSDDSLR